MDEFGAFPFGRPNIVRPMRRPVGPGKALIVGVYPSAFHVAWSPPSKYDPRDPSARRRPFIGSLAVDVEPIVFWDGIEPAPAVLLQEWRTAVGFDDERHGSVSVGNNGPSGAGLTRDVLVPLVIDASDVAFTDAVPWFFVKRGAGGQGEAIRTRFAPIAAELKLHQGSLPDRPTASQLVRLAGSEDRRETLRAEIVEVGAPLVITLGQEALDAVRQVADGCEGVQSRLTPDGYGQRGTLTVGSSDFELLPLVHPGFQRQAIKPEWKTAFARWSSETTSSRE